MRYAIKTALTRLPAFHNPELCGIALLPTMIEHCNKLNRRELFLVFAALELVYFKIPDALLRDRIYFHGIVSVSADILNAIASGELVSAQVNKRVSSNTSLEVIPVYSSIQAHTIIERKTRSYVQ